MGRTLQIVRAHIGKAKLVFLNTHLESTMVKNKRYSDKNLFLGKQNNFFAISP